MATFLTRRRAVLVVLHCLVAWFGVDRSAGGLPMQRRSATLRSHCVFAVADDRTSELRGSTLRSDELESASSEGAQTIVAYERWLTLAGLTGASGTGQTDDISGWLAGAVLESPTGVHR